MKKFLATTSMICVTAAVFYGGTSDWISHAAAMAPARPLMDESIPPAVRSACLAAVSNTTDNGDVKIAEMIFSEANLQVAVGVAPMRAPWRCLVSNRGVVANVRPLTNEGSL